MQKVGAEEACPADARRLRRRGRVQRDCCGGAATSCASPPPDFDRIDSVTVRSVLTLARRPRRRDARGGRHPRRARRHRAVGAQRAARHPDRDRVGRRTELAEQPGRLAPGARGSTHFASRSRYAQSRELICSPLAADDRSTASRTGLNGAARAGFSTTVQSVDPVCARCSPASAIMLETSILIGLVVPGDTIVLVASTAVDGPDRVLSPRHRGRRRRAERREHRLRARPVLRPPRSGDRGWAGASASSNWLRAENYLDRRGGIAVFISRFLPVLHSLVPLTVGMSTMRYRKFMAWTIPACIIWAFAYVSVGIGRRRELSATCSTGCTTPATSSWAIIVAVPGRDLRREEAARAQPRRGTWRDPGDGDANTIEDADVLDDHAESGVGCRGIRPLVADCAATKSGRCPSATRSRCRADDCWSTSTRTLSATRPSGVSAALTR